MAGISNYSSKKILMFIYITSAIIITFAMIYDSVFNQYNKKIEELRTLKNEKFKLSESSPIDEKASFKGLQYFEIDSKYNVMVNVIKIANPQTIQINTNDGKIQEFVKFAYLPISIDNIKDTLTLFKKKNDSASNMYFIPFSDLTSGKSTYGGGRYIDLEYNGSGSLTLDFNLAYSPYCAYNYKFSCPIPPKENFIKIEINAGEKNYTSH